MRIVLCFTMMLSVVQIGACDRRAPETPVPMSQKRVVVYSSIDADLLQPVLDHYAAETGLPILYVSDGEAALFERMKRKGGADVADLFIGAAIETLWFASDEDLVRPAVSELLQDALPEYLRDPDDTWFALALRPRAIAYNSLHVDASMLSGYRSLGDDQWQGRLCLATSTFADNRSLIARLIESEGMREAELIVRRWVHNLGSPIFDSDGDVVAAIEAGRCHVGIVDAALVAARVRKNADTAIRASVPSAMHFDVVGAGISRHASNPNGALRLLEWLASTSGQERLAPALSHRPANPAVAHDESAPRRAGADAASQSLVRFGYLAQDAADLAARARYP